MTDFTKPPTILKISEYVDAVMTTEVMPAHLTNIPEAPEWHWRWMHGVIGLVSEQYEVMNAKDFINLGEELGDRFWYHGLTSKALRVAHEALPSVGPFVCPIEEGCAHVSTPALLTANLFEVDANLCDVSKRLMCYSKKPTYAALHAAAVASVLATLRVARNAGQEPLVIMQANIHKLYARKVDAIKKAQQMGDMNRDLSNERAVLERALSV